MASAARRTQWRAYYKRNLSSRRAAGRQVKKSWLAKLEPGAKQAYYDSQRDKALQRKYGITAAQYALILELQEGKCAICRRPPKTARLHVDHDHHTGRVRGLLCYLCNRRLVGRHRDGRLLRLAAEYLDNTFDGRALVALEPLSPGVKPSITMRTVRSKPSA